MPPSPSSPLPPTTGLFIFHRDLRIVDNIAFSAAVAACDKLYTCFIFTPEQVSSSNQYRSLNSIQFMIESLEDLATQLRANGGTLLTMYGEPIAITRRLIKELSVDQVFFNLDYSPYARERDEKTLKLCDSLNDVSCNTYHDYCLYEPNTVLTSTNKPYQKFTPFYNAVINRPIIPPRKAHTREMLSRILSTSGKTISGKISLNDAREKIIGNRRINPHILVHGGRMHALLKYKSMKTAQKKYEDERDYLEYNTTFLSAYIKFGCLSIREVYTGIATTYGKKSGLLRELLWREFFTHVLYGFPNVLQGAFIEKYRKIAWHTSTRDFDRWKTGTTGVPIVDACMRQMNATGYMHNRGRMIVATFLCKTLLINWRLGEKYFAQKLTDYDPAANNGNWQSISSTGVDMKPYYRDMNPWIQSAKFDKDAVYIKHWVPELDQVEARDIHNWETMAREEKYKTVNYPAPMVIYSEQKKQMLAKYHHP